MEPVRTKLALAAPATAVLALTLTACGGDDSKAYDAWAKEVCGPAKPQILASETARVDLGRVVPGEKPVDLQQRLSRDLGTLSAANSGLADAIENAGAPKIKNTAAMTKTRADAVSELRATAKGYGGVKDKVDALDTGDQSKFAHGLKALGADTARLGASSDAALKKLQTGDYGAAMARQPGCKKIDAKSVPQPSITASPSPSASDGGKGGKGSASPSSSASSSAKPSGTSSSKSSASPSASSSASAR